MTQPDCLLQDQFQAPARAEQGTGRGVNWFTWHKSIILFLGSCARGSRLNMAHYFDIFIIISCQCSVNFAFFTGFTALESNVIPGRDKRFFSSPEHSD